MNGVIEARGFELVAEPSWGSPRNKLFRTLTTLAASSSRSLNCLRILASARNRSQRRRVRFGTLSARDNLSMAHERALVAILSW